MQDAWVTNAGTAAGQALNQEVGDVHAPSVWGKSKSAAEPPPAPCPFSCYWESDDIAPSIIEHHEHTNIVRPDMSSVAHRSSSLAGSAFMTAPDLTDASTPHPNPLRSWMVPQTPFPFDKSAQVRPCGSTFLGEGALPPVSEVPRDGVFASPPPAPPSRASSTTDTAPDTDGEPSGLQGQKQAAPSSNVDYSREHRTTAADRHRYTKQHLSDRLLTLLGGGPVLSALTLITIWGLLCSCPTTIANPFILPRGYRTAGVHDRVTAYDLHTSRCNIHTNPTQKDQSPRPPPLLRREEESHLAAPERVVAQPKRFWRYTPRLASNQPRT